MTVPSVTQKIKRTGSGTYSVPSRTIAGRAYHVDLIANTCQCQGFRHRGTCAHLKAAQARCAEVTAEKARLIPDVQIDELAAKYEASRPEISAVLYDEIRRRTADIQTEAVGLRTGLTDAQRRALFV